MSSAHAIAAVTKVLAGLVDDWFKAAGLAGIVGDYTVSALSPKRIDVSLANDPNQLNLFLYLALPNSGGSSLDLPTRDSTGARVKNTPLALDLYYLVTAYGSDDFFAEMLLGHAMQAFHENPIFARDAIRAQLKPGANPTNPELALATSSLAEQVEQVKISPEKLSTEEISRLWSALAAEYRPSVAYRVTVVLIEARVSTRTALPTLQRGLYVRLLSSPFIEGIAARSDLDEPALEDQPILPEYILVLTGKRLRGEITRIVIDGAKIDAPGAVLSNEQVEFPLPASLRSGPHGVQIVHEIAMGEPRAPHTGTESNVGAFLLRPEIKSATATAALVTLKLKPLVTPGQHIRLLLNELAAPGDRSARAFSFPAPVNNGIDVAGGDTETDTVRFAYNGVPTGSYLVRVQVDGAESVLQTDPATGAFFKPKVNIP
jgi:hypothetical protein